jgi:hypothetical protein
MKEAWESELQAATLARLAGNEGRARVCARRAAGMAARDFLTWNRSRPAGGNAYQSLLALSEFHGLTPDMRAAALHLTLRVNEEFTLPVEVDLIADARKLCETLSKDHDRT